MSRYNIYMHHLNRYNIYMQRQDTTSTCTILIDIVFTARCSRSKGERKAGLLQRKTCVPQRMTSDLSRRKKGLGALQRKTCEARETCLTRVQHTRSSTCSAHSYRHTCTRLEGPATARRCNWTRFTKVCLRTTRHVHGSYRATEYHPTRSSPHL
jgi:hypothetical protein